MLSSLPWFSGCLCIFLKLNKRVPLDLIQRVNCHSKSRNVPGLVLLVQDQFLRDVNNVFELFEVGVPVGNPIFFANLPKMYCCFYRC